MGNSKDFSEQNEVVGGGEEPSQEKVRDELADARSAETGEAESGAGSGERGETLGGHSDQPARRGHDRTVSLQSPDVDELRALGLLTRLPTTQTVARQTSLEARAAPVRHVPVYGPIDRSVPLGIFSFDIPVPATGAPRFIVRRPYSYPSGPLAGDPGHVPPYVDVGAVCYVLGPGAAARCLRQHGSWG